MTDKDDLPTQLLDAVNEMIKPTRAKVYVEDYDPVSKRRRRRVASVSSTSMLDQLYADVAVDDDTSPKAAGSGGSAGFESRAPGHFAPRELLGSLEHEVAVWVDWCGLDVRHDRYDTSCRHACAWTGRQILQVFIDQHLDLRYRSPCECPPVLVQRGLEANLGQLVGIAHRLDTEGWSDDLNRMTRRVKSLAGALRRYCGLERTFRPRASCPNPDCGVKRAFIRNHINLLREPHRRATTTLTVWIDEEGARADHARCHACGRTWDNVTVGLLIDHIRDPHLAAVRQRTGYRRLGQAVSGCGMRTATRLPTWTPRAFRSHCPPRFPASNASGPTDLPRPVPRPPVSLSTLRDSACPSSRWARCGTPAAPTSAWTTPTGLSDDCSTTSRTREAQARQRPTDARLISDSSS